MKKFLLAIAAIFFGITSTVAQETTNTIIANQGFSVNSLLRGALGMLVLLTISYLLSKNRKAISWCIKSTFYSISF